MTIRNTTLLAALAIGMAIAGSVYTQPAASTETDHVATNLSEAWEACSDSANSIDIDNWIWIPSTFDNLSWDDSVLNENCHKIQKLQHDKEKEAFEKWSAKVDAEEKARKEALVKQLLPIVQRGLEDPDGIGTK